VSNLQGLHGRTNEYNIKPYSMVYGVYGVELQVEEKTGGGGQKRHVDHDMVRTLSNMCFVYGTIRNCQYYIQCTCNSITCDLTDPSRSTVIKPS
jgi:hypothetical protein